MKKNILILLILFTLFSCEKDPAPVPDELPSELSYSIDSIALKLGTTATSVTPTISGTAPFSFSLSSSPDNGGQISIDGNGIISIANALSAGIYMIDVSVSNIAGTSEFPDAYRIRVYENDEPPSFLQYSPDSVSILLGTAFSSLAPNIQGTPPFTYSLTSVPDAGNDITINENGIISTTTNLDPDTYLLSVSVTNSAGNVSFDDVFKIVVFESSGVTFTNDISPLISQNCASCHTGGGNTNYTVYSNASSNINLILDRVQRGSGETGFMPRNRSPLSADEIQLLKDWKDQGLKE